MRQLSLLRWHPEPPPVTKTVVAFRGTEHEVTIEIDVVGRRRRIVAMRRLLGNNESVTPVPETS